MKREDIYSLLKLSNLKPTKTDLENSMKEDSFNIENQNNKKVFLRKKWSAEYCPNNIWGICKKIPNWFWNIMGFLEVHLNLISSKNFYHGSMRRSLMNWRNNKIQECKSIKLLNNLKEICYHNLKQAS